MRAVEPPANSRQALRGNLYCCVEVLGTGAADAETLADRMLSAIQRTYYTRKGSQSDVLIEAVREARHKVEEHNGQHPGAPARAGIICAALLGPRLLIVHNGPALALITAGSKIDRYPVDPANLERETLPDRPGNWELYRQEMAHGGAFFLGSARWLQNLPIRTLASTVAHLTAANSADAAAWLLEESGDEDLPGMLLVVERGPADAPPAAPRPGAGSPPVRRNRPPFMGGLPTAVNAAPPAHDMRASISHPHSTLPPVASAPAALPPDVAVQTSTQHAAGAAQPTQAADVVAAAAADLGAKAQAGLERFRTLLGGMLPERGVAGQAHMPLDEPAEESAPRFAAAPAVDDAPPAAHFPTLPPPPALKPSSGSRARLFLLLAVLILALTPVVVAAVYWQQGAQNRADAETLMDLAESRFLSGQDALDVGDSVQARSLLKDAQDYLASAVAIVGPSERTDALEAQIRQELQEVLQVKYLYELLDPLVAFPAEAAAKRVLAVDENVFVLDIGQQAVRRYRLDDSREFVPDPAGDVVLRSGDVVEGAMVGQLVDIAWLPITPGFEDKPNLLVLDANNQLFRYDGRVEGATRIELGDPAALRSPTVMKVYLGRTYIADEGTNQIVRYSAGGFGGSPEPWFAPQTQTDLDGLLAMGIDGDIWLLMANGTIVRYRGGEQVPFAMESSVGLAQEAVDLAVGTQDSALLYVADAAEERILVFDKQGAYQYQLMAPEGNMLRGLRGLYVDEVDGSMYILTETALFKHPIPN